MSEKENMQICECGNLLAFISFDTKGIHAVEIDAECDCGVEYKISAVLHIKHAEKKNTKA